MRMVTGHGGCAHVRDVVIRLQSVERIIGRELGV